MSLKSRIGLAFQVSGFRLRLDASRHLEALLQPLGQGDRDQWITKILEALRKEDLESVVIQKDLLLRVVQVSSLHNKEKFFLWNCLSVCLFVRLSVCVYVRACVHPSLTKQKMTHSLLISLGVEFLARNSSFPSFCFC